MARLPFLKVAFLLVVASLAPTTVGAGRDTVPAARSTPLVTPTEVGDPALAVRASRAVTATLPAATDGTATGGTVRLVLNPVTGTVCMTSAGIVATVAPPAATASGTVAPAATGVSLALPDGARLQLSDTTYAGCVSAAPTVGAGVLADPAAYSLLLVSTSGEQAVAPLAAAAAVGRPWSVGTRTEALVDRTRGTARRGRIPARPTRTIRVTYYYPTRGGASGSAAPLSLEGPFPVVLFSPGLGVTPATYARTLQAWAAAGYLVAGVLSPGSGGGLPGTPTEADLGAQPGDLSVALSAVLAHGRDAASWLGGAPDPHRVAVAGHSDGGSTAAAGLLARYADPRVDAVLVMAGASFGGQRARRALPLLVLSGARDEFNRASTFRAVFDLGHTTRTWVQAVDARHLAPFVAAGAQAEDLRALEIAFLDRSLWGADTRSVERGLAGERNLTRIAAGSF